MPLINKSDYPYPFRTIDGTESVSSAQVTATTINAVNSAGFGLTPTFQLITSGSGTFTSPGQAAYHIVELIGGGGGGGCNASQSGGGGGAGAYIKTMRTPGSYAYSVGTGGAGTSGATANGASGGATTFDGTSADGGRGGFGQSSVGTSGSGFSGGQPSDAATYISQSWGGSGLGAEPNKTGEGGSSYYSGETISQFNVSSSTAVAGNNGAAYGGGGEGSKDGGKAGNGAAGCILVSTFY